jgi:hypothetical protein
MPEVRKQCGKENMWEEQLMPMKAAEVMGMLQWEEDSEIGSSDTKFVPQTMYQTHYDKPSDYSSLNERAPIDPCLITWFPVVETVCEGLGYVTFLKEVCYCGWALML